jgi:hypothetical protein
MPSTSDPSTAPPRSPKATGSWPPSRITCRPAAPAGRRPSRPVARVQSPKRRHVAYKAFYNRLARPGFVRRSCTRLDRLIERLCMQTLALTGPPLGEPLRGSSQAVPRPCGAARRWQADVHAPRRDVCQARHRRDRDGAAWPKLAGEPHETGRVAPVKRQAMISGASWGVELRDPGGGFGVGKRGQDHRGGNVGRPGAFPRGAGRVAFGPC